MLSVPSLKKGWNPGPTQAGTQAERGEPRAGNQWPPRGGGRGGIDRPDPAAGGRTQPERERRQERRALGLRS